MNTFFGEGTHEAQSTAKRVAANIRSLRCAKSWTQQSLADKCDVSLRTIVAWERELRDLEKVDALALVFGCSRARLLA